MLTPVNIESRFEDVTELWSPKVIGRVNDQYVKIARLQGSKVPSGDSAASQTLPANPPVPKVVGQQPPATPRKG